MLKEKLLNLVDRRTVITLITVSLLFILAFRGEKIALGAMDGIVFIAVSLVGANAAQNSLKAFATRNSNKPKAVKPASKDASS